MIARILAGGVLVCINIDEEAAGDLLNKLVATDYALSILNREELNLMWRNFIGQVRSSANVHPLLSGYATRLLNDKGEISAEEMETTLSFYSSVGNCSGRYGILVRRLFAFIRFDSCCWTTVSGIW